MGLDMYLYAIKKGYEGCYPEDTEQRIEIAYWRKHHDLHGMMEEIWTEKGSPLPETRNPNDPLDTVDTDFNCIPLPLDVEDITYVMSRVKANKLPKTQGFFFGDNPPDTESKRRDLKVFKEALALAKLGYKIYYDSWW